MPLNARVSILPMREGASITPCRPDERACSSRDDPPVQASGARRPARPLPIIGPRPLCWAPRRLGLRSDRVEFCRTSTVQGAAARRGRRALSVGARDAGDRCGAGPLAVQRAAATASPAAAVSHKVGTKRALSAAAERAAACPGPEVCVRSRSARVCAGRRHPRGTAADARLDCALGNCIRLDPRACNCSCVPRERREGAEELRRRRARTPAERVREAARGGPSASHYSLPPNGRGGPVTAPACVGNG